MTNENLNIRLTEAELGLIMDLLHEAGGRVDADGQPAFELCHDLMEQSGDIAEDSLEGRTFTLTEDDMIQRGMDAREEAKANSRAAMRRNERLMKGTASPCVAEFMNDPVDW